MRNSVYVRFLVYSLTFSVAATVLAVSIDIIKGNFILKDTLIIVFGLLLFSILFSFFASICAKRVTIKSKNIDFINKSLQDIEGKDKFIVNKDGNIITISSSKYYEWFYGKTIIHADPKEYRIEGAQCVIGKYFKVWKSLHYWFESG